MNDRPMQSILNLFRSKSKRHVVSCRGRTTRLSVEPLEHRTLLAANIFEGAADALAVPASAKGATQISGEGLIVAVRDGETPAFTVDCPDPGGDYSNFGDLTISLTDGNLRGCWYTLVEEYKFSPSDAAEPVIYQERGREVFVGELWDGDESLGEGTFETTYKFTGKYADATLVEELHGRCQHPLVNGTGTGVFEGYTGRVDFKDDVETGILDYRGHFKLENGKALHADGEPSGVLVGRELTHEMLEQSAQQAIALWAVDYDVAELTGVNVRIAQLNDTMLGYATDDTIWIDRDAAGYGWKADEGGLDLLHVLKHEFGHVLGFDHDHGGVMEAKLAPQPSAAALEPSNQLVAGFLSPLPIQERDALFSQIGQSDVSVPLKVEIVSQDFQPVAPIVNRSDFVTRSRIDGDVLDDELEPFDNAILDDLLKDADAA